MKKNRKEHVLSVDDFYDEYGITEEMVQKFIKAEDDYRNGRTRKMEEVFKEWDKKYGV